MQGQFIVAASKQFVNLGNGLIKNSNVLEEKYNTLTSDAQKELCKRDLERLKKQIDDIIKQLQTIVKIINSILKVLNKLLSFLKFLQILTAGLLIAIQILKAIPSFPFSPTLRLSDVLAKANFQLQAAFIIITGIDVTIKFLVVLLTGALNLINNILNKLKLNVEQLNNCNTNDSLLVDSNGNIVKDNSNGLGVTTITRSSLADDLNNNINLLNQSLNDLNQQIGELLKSSNSYKGFTFQIIEEQTSTKQVAKRRYAIAVNSNGILTLQGELSYATDSQVLIDELKLIIDSKNLSGYSV